MAKKDAKALATLESAPIDVIALPETRRVYAVVVGVEEYRTEGRSPLRKVDYARNDTKDFARVLEEILPSDRLDVRLLIDNDATFDTEWNTIHLQGGGRQDCATVPERSRRFHFGLTLRSMLLGGEVNRIAQPADTSGKGRIGGEKR
jgi:hypothetical protein